MGKLKNENPCDGCGAKCCCDVTVELDEPDCKRDFEDIKWMIYHENIRVYIDNDDDFVIEFKTRCKQLDENDQCKVYDKRPPMCRNHGTDECIELCDGEDIVRKEFKTAEDVDEYYKEWAAKEKKEKADRKRKVGKK